MHDYEFAPQHITISAEQIADYKSQREKERQEEKKQATVSISLNSINDLLPVASFSDMTPKPSKSKSIEEAKRDTATEVRPAEGSLVENTTNADTSFIESETSSVSSTMSTTIFKKDKKDTRKKNKKKGNTSTVAAVQYGPTHITIPNVTCTGDRGTDGEFMCQSNADARITGDRLSLDETLWKTTSISRRLDIANVIVAGCC